MIPVKWHKKIFLIDGLGAITSALFLIIVLPMLNTGMPYQVLYILGLAAVLFSIFSLYTHFSGKYENKTHLKIIAFSNLNYIAATVFVLISYYEQINFLAKFYLIAEMVIIFIIVWNEKFILTKLLEEK